MGYEKNKQQLLETVKQAYHSDLIRLSAGNISTRIDDDLIAITPSGIQYSTMVFEDISIVNLEGDLIEGPQPSSEVPMHTAIHKHVPRVKSICHTHSKYAMVFAMIGEEIPLVSIELMTCGAPIPVGPWATPGTPRAGEVAVDIFQSREELSVMLLRQHGLLAIGDSLQEAYTRAMNAEVGLEIYFKAKLIGEPKAFTAAQISEIRAVYGV